MGKRSKAVQSIPGRGASRTSRPRGAAEAPAFPMTLTLRPLLCGGQLRWDERSISVLIDNESGRAEQGVSIFHETLHLLRIASGHADASAHDESLIEAMALKLAQACPEIVEWCTPPSSQVPSKG